MHCTSDEQLVTRDPVPPWVPPIRPQIHGDLCTSNFPGVRHKHATQLRVLMYHTVALSTRLLTLYLSLTRKVAFEDAMFQVETSEATEAGIEVTSVEPGETVEEAIEGFLADF